ncbi:spore coat protein [Bacillus halotolerans]|uniref:spore coat protein n=1 Tax=Bacillus halotolerans TaxID=260554 RepID=UPI000BFEBE50|nr:spore coat protein [Bacillus halotolerans]MBL4975692.1 spore coat protein [Bacillus halotolerans]MDG3075079.1 spore coat protein [Bacillus halotolerans]PHI48521.1 spore coat protein [Bacillus halotolerans]UTL73577.1 spore coat protein [Bacillus halotolerans]
MEQDRLANHETVDLHEILNFKTVCLLKSKMMQGLVFDQELRTLMEKDVQQSVRDVTELQSLYQKAPTITGGDYH